MTICAMCNTYEIYHLPPDDEWDYPHQIGCVYCGKIITDGTKNLTEEQMRNKWELLCLRHNLKKVPPYAVEEYYFKAGLFATIFEEMLKNLT